MLVRQSYGMFYYRRVSYWLYVNMRQKWWMELIKDYDLSVLYHIGKANVVANALSRWYNYGAIVDLTE